MKSKTFKIGDNIRHENDTEWHIATEYDVANYSGRNGWYYIKNIKKCKTCK